MLSRVCIGVGALGASLDLSSSIHSIVARPIPRRHWHWNWYWYGLVMFRGCTVCIPWSVFFNWFNCPPIHIYETLILMLFRHCNNLGELCAPPRFVFFNCPWTLSVTSIQEWNIISSQNYLVQKLNHDGPLVCDDKGVGTIQGAAANMQLVAQLQDFWKTSKTYRTTQNYLKDEIQPTWDNSRKLSYYVQIGTWSFSLLNKKPCDKDDELWWPVMLIWHQWGTVVSP